MHPVSEKISIAALLACLIAASSLNGDVLTVDHDGSADYVTVQAALAAASEGDTIFIRAGTYVEDELTPTGAITIEGEVDSEQLPAVTLMSSESVVIYLGPGTDSAVLKNLVLTTGSGHAVQSWHSKPTLMNCTFLNSGAEDPVEFTFAGGMYNLNGAPTLIDCRFINNRGGQGGGFSTWESGPDPTNHPLFVRCTFRGNVAYSGGALANLRSNPTLVACVFENNIALESGGAIYNDGFDGPDFWISRPVLENCTFRNNVAQMNGGAIFNEGSSESTLHDCLFIKNSANSGGAIMNNGASFSTLTDSTACANLPDQITGTWHDNGGNTVTDACPTVCIGDINDDGLVNGEDLTLLLSAWQSANAAADLNGDGAVNGADLTMLLGAWGLCA